MTQMQSKKRAELLASFVQNLQFIDDVLTLLADACLARAAYLTRVFSSDTPQITKLQNISRAIYWIRDHGGLGDDLEDVARIIHEEET